MSRRYYIVDGGWDRNQKKKTRQQKTEEFLSEWSVPPDIVDSPLIQQLKNCVLAYAHDSKRFRIQTLFLADVDVWRHGQEFAGDIVSYDQWWKAVYVLVTEGLVEVSTWRSDYDTYFSVTKAGCERWKVIEDDFWREVREQQNKIRFGVPWNPHELARKEGYWEW